MDQADWQRISHVNAEKPFGAPIDVACQEWDQETPLCVDPDRRLPIEVSLHQCLQLLRDRLGYCASIGAGGDRGQALCHCRVCHLLIPGRNLLVLKHFCCSDMGESRTLADNDLLLRIIFRGIYLFLRINFRSHASLG